MFHPTTFDLSATRERLDAQYAREDALMDEAMALRDLRLAALTVKRAAFAVRQAPGQHPALIEDAEDYATDIIKDCERALAELGMRVRPVAVE